MRAHLWLVVSIAVGVMSSFAAGQDGDFYVEDTSPQPIDLLANDTYFRSNGPHAIPTQQATKLSHKSVNSQFEKPQLDQPNPIAMTIPDRDPLFYDNSLKQSGVEVRLTGLQPTTNQAKRLVSYQPKFVSDVDQGVSSHFTDATTFSVNETQVGSASLAISDLPEEFPKMDISYEVIPENRFVESADQFIPNSDSWVSNNTSGNRRVRRNQLFDTSNCCDEWTKVCPCKPSNYDFCSCGGANRNNCGCQLAVSTPNRCKTRTRPSRCKCGNPGCRDRSRIESTCDSQNFEKDYEIRQRTESLHSNREPEYLESGERSSRFSMFTINFNNYRR